MLNLCILPKSKPRSLWIFFGFLLSNPLTAEMTCERNADQVGIDQGYPVRSAMAAVPHGQVTGREVIRYFVRLDSACLLSHGMRWVDALAVRLNNDLMSSGSCRPTSVGQPARVLSGMVPSSEAFDTRELEVWEVDLPKPPMWTVPIPETHREIMAHKAWVRNPITRKPEPFGTLHVDVDNSDHVAGGDPFAERSTEQQGGWASLRLGKELEVREGYDVILGLEVPQEPWECPLLISGPFEALGNQQGSYLQLVNYEIQTTDGGTEWRPLDCNGTGVGAAVEGLAFPVEDLEARSRCGLQFPHTSFQWNLRAIGRRSEGSMAR